MFPSSQASGLEIAPSPQLWTIAALVGWLLGSLLARKHLVAVEQGYGLTPSGVAWLADLGLDADREAPRGRRYAYPCLDWSERREHLAGRLATVLLEHFMAQRWLARVADSRALRVTPMGERMLLGAL